MFHSRSADLIRDHRSLLHLVTDLIHEGAYAEADYVLAVIRTELAELGHAPAGSDWLRPGQAAPVGRPMTRCSAINNSSILSLPHQLHRLRLTFSPNGRCFY
jgi:hypothetical protein